MKVWLAAAAINGFLAVAAGEFAAHGLSARLDAHALSIFETGARYHMYHVLAMGLAATARANAACWFFLIGIVLFSGSLYGLALTDMRAFAFVTPIGGISFLMGWAALAWSALRAKA